MISRDPTVVDYPGKKSFFWLRWALSRGLGCENGSYGLAMHRWDFRGGTITDLLLPCHHSTDKLVSEGRWAVAWAVQTCWRELESWSRPDHSLRHWNAASSLLSFSNSFEVGFTYAQIKPKSHHSLRLEISQRNASL